MRGPVVLAILGLVASTATAEVWTDVYRHDGVTPLPPADPNDPNAYREIMVGTHLVLVVSSDVGEVWWGSLEMAAEDWACATLGGRGYDTTRGNYRGSALEAAGFRAGAWPFNWFGTRRGFELNSTFLGVGPGPWFVFDYFAERAGSTQVGLYDMAASVDKPLEVLSFRHVPSRDYNADLTVNFDDFALFARQFGATVGAADSNDRPKTDLDGDGAADRRDLAWFCAFWLERTDAVESGSPTASEPQN